MRFRKNLQIQFKAYCGNLAAYLLTNVPANLPANL